MLADIDGEKVKTLNVPYYENLTLAHIWKFAADHPEVNKFLPAEEDRDDLPRSWVVNVLFSVLGGKFAKWINRQMEARNKLRLKDQNKEAVMLPKFAASFRASTDISCKYKHSLNSYHFLHCF